MPSTYAHRRIGKDVANLLPPELRKTVKDNYTCFALGLHGPDLLFYYKPICNNAVNAEGYAIHNRFASDFFARAKEIYLSRGKKEGDAAYLFGFICHFSLDSESHPYVNKKIVESGVTHTEIESCFDRFLMQEDGIQPFEYDISSHIVPDDILFETAAAYFGVTEKQASKAVKSLKFYNKLMTTRSPLIRGGAKLILNLSGNYKEMHGMMLPLKDDERCADSNRILTDCYAVAVAKAVRLIENLRSFLDGEEKMSVELDRDFE